MPLENASIGILGRTQKEIDLFRTTIFEPGPRKPKVSWEVSSDNDFLTNDQNDKSQGRGVSTVKKRCTNLFYMLGLFMT